MKKLSLTFLSLVPLFISSAHAQDKRLVLSGKSGWLFYNEQPISASDLAQLPEIYKDIKTLKALLDRRNIRLHIVLVPRKETIYGNNLTAEDRASLRMPDTYDSTLEQLRKLGISITDLRPVFLQATTENKDVFYRTDTHWNSEGANLAAKTVAADLKLSSDSSLPTATYKVSSSPLSYSGDLSKIIGDSTPESSTMLNFERTDQQGLFDDITPGITLIGTSYSASTVFPKALSAALGKDVLNASLPGLGDVEPFKRYLSSTEFQTHPPKVIIWEIPERLLARNFVTTDASETLQFGADLSDSCTAFKSEIPLQQATTYKNLIWWQFLRVKIPPIESITISKSGKFVKDLDAIEGTIVNLTDFSLADTKLGSKTPITASLLKCEYPSPTLERLTNWKVLDIAGKRVQPAAHLTGLYPEVEPNGARSGYGPKTVAKFWTSQATTVHIDIRTHNFINNQIVTISFNGKVIKKLSYDTNSLGDLITNITTQSGANTIEVSYADWNGKTEKYFPQDDRPVGILFTKFVISK